MFLRNFGVILSVGALLTGCGGGGDSSSPPSSGSQPPPQTPAPETPAPQNPPPETPAPETPPPETPAPETPAPETPAPETPAPETPPPESPPPEPPPPQSTVPPRSTTVVTLDGGRIGKPQWPIGNSDTGGQGQAVDGIDCLPSMPDDYHVHTHLSIFLNGEALAVPQNIGIVDSDTAQCFYSIHTHDATGKLHIEAAAADKFTLGQFFDIWGRTFSNIEVGGLVGMPIVVYVTDPNGEVTEIPDDQWQDIELLSHREITIQIGSAITEIPNFTWDGP